MTVGEPVVIPGEMAESADLRTGAPLHDGLLALLPLVGRWAGAGAGRVPEDGRDFRFAQEMSFTHDGRPFLVYDSRTWLLNAAGEVLRPAARESGYWRPGPGQDDVEVVLALNTGLTLVLTGLAGDQRWEIATTRIAGTPTAKAVEGNRRLYAIVGGDLTYAQELARPGEDFVPHLTARLQRR